MKPSRLLVMLIIGIVLFVPAILGANWMGQRWTNSPDAATPWWLNPSFSVTAKTAYNFFAVWNWGLPNVEINGWNFYIFAMLIPLWLGSFLISFPTVHTLIQSRK